MLENVLFVGEKSVYHGTTGDFLTIPAAIRKDVGNVKRVKIFYVPDKKEMIVNFFEESGRKQTNE